MESNNDLPIKNSNKYGIYQSSGASCMFYKEDEEGNQSTFNLFIVPERYNRKKSILTFIDNEHIGKQNWFGDEDLTIQEIFDAFDKWANGGSCPYQNEERWFYFNANTKIWKSGMPKMKLNELTIAICKEKNWGIKGYLEREKDYD